MNEVRLYLHAIEEISRIERGLAGFNDAQGLALRDSALDAAKAAWLSLSADWQAKLEPPPERSGLDSID